MKEFKKIKKKPKPYRINTSKLLQISGQEYLVKVENNVGSKIHHNTCMMLTDSVLQSDPCDETALLRWL